MNQNDRAKKILYSFIKNNIIKIVAFVLLAVLGLLVSLYQPIIFGNITDSLVGHDLEQTMRKLRYFVLVSLLGVLLMSSFRIGVSKIIIDLIGYLKRKMYESISYAFIYDVDSFRKGDLLATFESDSMKLSNFMLHGILSAFVNVLTLFVIYGYIINLDLELTIILTIVIPMEVFVSKMIGKKIKELAADVRAKNADCLDLLSSTLCGLKDIKSFCLEPYMVNKMEVSVSDYSTSSFKTSVFQELLKILNRMFGIAINFMVLFAFSFKIDRAIASVGMLVAFLNYSSRMYSAISALSDIYAQWKNTMVSWERIAHIIDMPAENDSAIFMAKKKSTYISGDIKFNEIKFTYPEPFQHGKCQYVFEDFSTILDSRVPNIITGKSGRGKTTLCELLLKLYRAEQGEILFGEQTIDELDVNNLRRRISFSPQEPYFWGRNIFEMLEIVNPNASKNDIEVLLEELDLRDVIQSKSEQTDRDFQMELSVGQKQRLNIARGVIKEADIYIFDEPTASLDPQTKKLALNVILNRCCGKMLIIITHDDWLLQNIENVNHISI